MKTILKKALQLLVGDAALVDFRMPKRAGRPFKKLTERELIQLESAIGAQLFGPIPTGNRREFFCLDKSTWIWHEEWTDTTTNKRRSTTTRYEIHDNGILKVQEGARYNFIEGEELENLAMAVRLYEERVAREVYNRDPKTGIALSA